VKGEPPRPVDNDMSYLSYPCVQITCPDTLEAVVVDGMKIKNGTVPLYIRGNPAVIASIAFGVLAAVISNAASGRYATMLTVPLTHDTERVID
jgi:anti-sigma factor RsiW